MIKNGQIFTADCSFSIRAQIIQSPHHLSPNIPCSHCLHLVWVLPWLCSMLTQFILTSKITVIIILVACFLPCFPVKQLPRDGPTWQGRSKTCAVSSELLIHFYSKMKLRPSRLFADTLTMTAFPTSTAEKSSVVSVWWFGVKLSAMLQQSWLLRYLRDLSLHVLENTGFPGRKDTGHSP